MTARGQTRAIDHCVLPVASLAVARNRLTQLGFQVAPRGDHPFGTANACVYLEDGSFLEPLAIADPGRVADSARQGNVFTARDSDYRERVGAEGFSALVLTTTDAAADHRRFVRQGISGGDRLGFSRPFTAADGKVGEAGFQLAFAVEPRSTDCFFFTCERTSRPAVDRALLQAHENLALGIARILISAPDPENFGRFVREIAIGGGMRRRDHGVDIPVRNATLSILDAHGAETEFGVPPNGQSGPRLEGIVFATTQLRQAAAVLDKGGVVYEWREGRILVSRAAGQGAMFAFEERK